MDFDKKLTRVNDTEDGKTTAGMGGTQSKKPYNAPQLIEHGSVEGITGFITNCVGSACTA